MYHSDPSTWLKTKPKRRQYQRLDIQCRARIRIGNRQYSGYLHNISQGGAKLRTITPIGRLGKVVLRLPDLPPLQCSLRWTDAYNAGVSFELALKKADLVKWAEARSAVLPELVEAIIAEPESVPPPDRFAT